MNKLSHRAVGRKIGKSCNYMGWNLSSFGNDNNILFITGFSGSGKSTLAYKLQDKIKDQLSMSSKNCYTFEMDGIEMNYDTSGIGLLKETLKDFPREKYLIEHDWIDKNGNAIKSSERFRLLEPLYSRLVEICEAKKDKLFILEGIQIIEGIEPRYLQSKSVIIMGTSMFKSIFRVVKRDGNEKFKFKNLRSLLSNEFKQRLAWYKDDSVFMRNLALIMNKYAEENNLSITIESDIDTTESMTKEGNYVMNNKSFQVRNIFEGAYESTFTNGLVNSQPVNTYDKDNLESDSVRDEKKTKKSRIELSEAEEFNSWVGNLMGEDVYPILEQKLSTSERNALPDEMFGLPSQRKYPMNDESHLRDAIKFFHFCKVEDREELANNIRKFVKQYNLDIDLSQNKLISKYLTEDDTVEETE